MKIMLLGSLCVVAAVAASIPAPTKPKDVEVCVPDTSKAYGYLLQQLEYVCGAQGGVDCAAINKGGDRWFPNTLTAHCDWAFEQYYEMHKAKMGKKACDLGGAAYLTKCSTDCTICRTRTKAVDKQLYSDIGYLCGGVGKAAGVLGGLCSAILPNGTHYEPNNLRSHTDWAVNEYYQLFRCYDSSACFFSNTTEVVSC